MKHRGSCFVLLLALVGTGCSEKGGATGTVSGTVSYGGQTLPVGSVTFLSEDGRTAAAEINKDGTYKVGNVPVGTVKVGVSTPQAAPVPALGGDMPGMNTAKPVIVPQKYASPQTSGLTMTVKKGSQTFDIAIPK